MATVTVRTKNVLTYIEKYNIASMAIGNLTAEQKKAETLQIVTRSGRYGDTIDILVRANDDDIATLLDVIDVHNLDEPSHQGREDEVATLAEKMAFLLGV